MSKVIVVGAGAAGCMAAGTAAKNGNDVLLLERNDKIARKVLVTGKGRCNVTNAETDIQTLISNVPQNGRFLYSAFSEFNTTRTREFFENLGVPLKVERGNRVFPVSDRAMDIVDALNKFITQSSVKRKTARVKKLILEGSRIKGVETENGETYFADKVIIATGGKSYSKTGSTGDGYILARSVGHNIVDIKPSLVALTCREGYCSEAMGLSLRNAAIKVIDTKTGKQIYSDFGEMLFTHFGVSGPMILSASAHMRNMESGRYEIYIDMKPALDEHKLDERIQRDLLENSNKAISNSLGMLLPRAIINPVIRLSKIRPATKCNQVTKEMRQSLVSTIKNMKLTVLNFCSIEEAIITSGGVDCKQLNPKTMESKLCENLYFAGEVIDVDAYTGGFNLQIAFSTGYVAGMSV